MSAFNGSGQFVISGTGLPYVTGTTISSTVANQLDTDLATGLSTTITKDGQTTTTAAIPFGTLGIKTDKVDESTANAGVAVKGTSASPVTNAAAGYVGEYISSTIAFGAGVSLVTNTSKTITSIPLTAGDWDVFGVGSASSNTSISSVITGPSLTTDTDGALDATTLAAGITGNANLSPVFPTTRFNVAATTTVYLVVKCGFAGTAVGYGRISARRAR